MSDYEFWDELANIFNAVLSYQQKTVEFNKRFVNPWIHMGTVFDRNDRSPDLLGAYKKAVEIDPGASDNWRNLGDMYMKMGMFDDAFEAYNKAVELDPGAGWAHANLALAQDSRQNNTEAIGLYLKSLEIITDDKDRAMIWNRLGNVYRKINDYDNAVIAFQLADEADADNTGFHDRLDEDAPNLEVFQDETQESVEAVQASEDSDDAPTAVGEAVSITDVAVAEEASVNAVVVEPAAEPEMQIIEVGEHPAEDPSLPALEIEATAATAQAIEPVTEVPESNAVLEAVDTDDAVQEVMLENAAEPTAEEIEAAPEPKWNDIIRKETVFDLSPETVNVEAVAAQDDVPDAEVSEKTTLTATFAHEVETVANAADAGGAVVVASEELTSQPVQADGGSESAAVEVEAQAVSNDADTAEESSAPVTPVEAEAQPEVQVEAGDAALESTEVEVPVVESVAESEAEAGNAESTPLAKKVVESALQHTTVNEADTQSNDSIIKEIISLALRGNGNGKEAAYEEFLKDSHGPVIAPVEPSAETGEVDAESTHENAGFKVDPDTKNAHVWNELGNVYFNTGAFEEAITAYRRAIELDNLFAWPYSNLALVFVQKEKYSEAVLLYQRSIELFASDQEKAITWNRLGNVYRRLDDYDNAIASYQRADELDPNNTTRSLRSRFSLLGSFSIEQAPSLAI